MSHPISGRLFPEFQLFPELESLVDPRESSLFAELETSIDPNEERLFAELEAGFAGLEISDDLMECPLFAEDEISDDPMGDVKPQRLQASQRLNPDRVMPNSDRHIPSREAMKARGSIQTHNMPSPQSNYEKKLVEALFPNYSEKTLHCSAPKKCEFKYERSIPPKWEYPLEPSKTLIIRDFKDNFYSNNLDWGSRFLAVSAEKAFHVWNRRANVFVASFHSAHINNAVNCSLKWNPTGNRIAVGNSSSELDVFNPSFSTAVFHQRVYYTKSVPICAMDWKSDIELTAACKEFLIHFDTRRKSFSAAHSHAMSNICSLEWSPNGSLLASGGDDNIVRIFDVRRCNEPVFSYSHFGGVKGLKWMPDSSILLSGGGTADKMIKVFNATKGEQICEADTGVQICSIECLDSDEFVCGTGYTAGGIQFWRLDRNKSLLKKVHEVHLGAERVFNVSKNPNNLEFSSISSDGKLRIWDVKQPSSGSKPQGFTIR